jgi:hypothetical protein
VAVLLVTAAALALLRMSDGWAIVAYALAAFVTVTVAQEFVRGSAARHRQYHEAWPLAVVRLVGRNRRRYGGYVVHLGMVMLFAGFAGLADVFPGFRDIGAGRLKFAAGSGLRYVINKRDGATVRLDLAWGQESFGLYITAREAF